MGFLFCLLILLTSWQAHASWTCAEVFDKPAIGFFKHLFGSTPGQQTDTSATVKFLGVQKDGRLAFRQKRNLLTGRLRSWDSSFNLLPDTSTPQGDLRNFIYAAGPRLAYKFGFEFREDWRGVVLLVPSAERIEKTIRALNVYLIKNGKEPITYLPRKTGFLNHGESLKLATNHQKEHGVLVQFPYADADPILVLHEVAYHLGSILFPKAINVKVAELNDAVHVASSEISRSKIPRGSIVASWLIGLRESELDIGNGNLQLKLAALRRESGLYPYSAYSMDSGLLRATMDAMTVLTRPYYLPNEYIARRLILLLGLESHFADRPDLISEMDSISKTYFDDKTPDVFKLPLQDALAYVPYIRALIAAGGETLDPLLRPTSEELVRYQLLAPFEQRIRQLTEAFDAIGSL